MKTKGRIAWLITWEGPESENNGRCKVVVVVPPQFGEKFITSILPFLYCSEYNFTLCEKRGFSTPNRKDSFFKEAYREVNPEFYYGHFLKEYLRARKVKDLRCEESKKDCFEATLYWTELPKFIPNPDIGPDDPLPADRADLCKQVRGEREGHYTYSARRQQLGAATTQQKSKANAQTTATGIPASMGTLARGMTRLGRDHPVHFSALGEEYLKAAVTLNIHHSDKMASPTFSLVYQALELYLKAFLRAKGVSVEDLKNRIGHDLKRGFDKAMGLGLGSTLDFTDELGAEIAKINRYHKERDFQYRHSGEWELRPVAALISLVERVRRGLRC